TWLANALRINTKTPDEAGDGGRVAGCRTYATPHWILTPLVHNTYSVIKRMRNGTDKLHLPRRCRPETSLPPSGQGKRPLGVGTDSGLHARLRSKVDPGT